MEVNITYSMQHIRAMEVNRVERVCFPRVLPGFMEATICTFSSPTHSRFWS